MNLPLNIYWWYYPRPELAVGYIPNIEAADEVKRKLGNQISAERGDFTIPENILEQLHIIQTELSTFMESPKPVNTGFKEVIPKQEVFDFRTFEDRPGVIHFQYREITLPPEGVETKLIELNFDQLSKLTKDAITQINAFAYLLALKDYILRHGSTEEEVKQIVGEKQRIFVSYRRRIREFATRIYSELKNYVQGAFFDPFIDHIDLGPGLWLQNLERELAELKNGDSFLPILTLDYFDGPVSVLEYSKIIGSAETRGITVIPIRHEGNTEDYKDKFIAEYNTIEIKDTSETEEYQEKIEKLVSWIISVRPKS